LRANAERENGGPVDENVGTRNDDREPRTSARIGVVLNWRAHDVQ